jgi:hypothetical protein
MSSPDSFKCGQFLTPIERKRCLNFCVKGCMENKMGVTTVHKESTILKVWDTD